MDTTRNPDQLVGPSNAERSVGQDRNLFCASYDRCLDEAVSKGWNSWTCERCAIFAFGRAADSLERYAQSRTICAWMT